MLSYQLLYFSDTQLAPMRIAAHQVTPLHQDSTHQVAFAGMVCTSHSQCLPHNTPKVDWRASVDSRE
jgi:hypothetical protein